MATPAQVMNTNGGTSSLQQYPSTLSTQTYFMGLSFVKYIRSTADADARFEPAGNIYLPLPDQLREDYSMDYGQDNLGLFRENMLSDVKEFVSSGASVLSQGKGTLSDAFNGDKDALKSASRLMTGEVGKYLVAMQPTWLTERGWNGGLRNATKIVKNPHITMLFEGMNLRSHNFSWVFSPRSQDESNSLQNIITTIKRHAHPTFSPGMGNYALDFPNQVFANFVGTSFLYPVKRSVITGISVDNGAGGQPVFYAGGAPVQIGLTVQMTEVEILTRDDFGGGATNYTAKGDYATAEYYTDPNPGKFGRN